MAHTVVALNSHRVVSQRFFHDSQNKMNTKKHCRLVLAFLTLCDQALSAMFGVLNSARSEMENTTKAVF